MTPRTTESPSARATSTRRCKDSLGSDHLGPQILLLNWRSMEQTTVTTYGNLATEIRELAATYPGATTNRVGTALLLLALETYDRERLTEILAGLRRNRSGCPDKEKGETSGQGESTP